MVPHGGKKEPLLNNRPYDPHGLPDFEIDFISNDELEAFSNALAAPTTTPVTALNDWRPIRQKIKKAKRRREARRTKDETREGFVYTLLYYPLLFGVLSWIIFLVSCLLEGVRTRCYDCSIPGRISKLEIYPRVALSGITRLQLWS